jgi:hypothetical protein
MLQLVLGLVLLLVLGLVLVLVFVLGLVMESMGLLLLLFPCILAAFMLLIAVIVVLADGEHGHQVEGELFH